MQRKQRPVVTNQLADSNDDIDTLNTFMENMFLKLKDTPVNKVCKYVHLYHSYLVCFLTVRRHTMTQTECKYYCWRISLQFIC
jgi:hypothetical protein